MVTIQVEVSPEVVQKFGVEALRQRFQRTVEIEQLAILAEKTSAALKEAGLNYHELAEKARQEAWKKYKPTHFNK